MISWVIGRGGLLGSSIERQFSIAGASWSPSQPIQWVSQETFSETLLAAADQFFELIGDDEWSILWCAGIGVVSSAEEVLNKEITKIRVLLENLARYDRSILRRGVLFYASSAGGIYAGSASPPFDEYSVASPLGPYGAQKLACEQLFTEFAGLTGARVGIGRIANLYGPGQNRSKSQGIVTTICKAMLLHQLIDIYVPLETMRNYIYVDDAATIIASFVLRLGGADPESTVTKVVASDRNSSLSLLLHECKQVFGRRPGIILSRSSTIALHARDLRLRSKVWTEIDQFMFTPMAVGISRVRRHLEIELQLGNVH
jgi:UDP-glucose 4-epimerase